VWDELRHLIRREGTTLVLTTHDMGSRRPPQDPRQPRQPGRLVTGKALSAGVRPSPQALIVYAVGAAIGVDLRLTPGPLFG